MMQIMLFIAIGCNSTNVWYMTGNNYYPKINIPENLTIEDYEVFH
jgi:hypothetical protein